MNIFVTSPSAKLSAMALDDKRVIKMALETAQLLSSAVRLAAGEDRANAYLYKVTHRNHPCAVWARADLRNFLWLYDHGVALCDEYKFRFERRHRSRDVIDPAYEHVLYWGDFFPGKADEVTFDFNSSGFVVGNDVFQNYRLCMVRKWHELDVIPARWTYRSRPEWHRTYYELYKSLTKENTNE